LVADDLPVVDPEAWQGWLTRPRDHAPHGGETEVDLERRAIRALSSIVSKHPVRTVLVVSHGGTIRATLRAWLGVDTHHTPNCGAYVIEATPSERKLTHEIRLPQER
jgi:broad specificity phosphatase PhoE